MSRITAKMKQKHNPETGKLLRGIMLLGFALRLAAAIWLPDQSAQWPDANAYRAIGEHLRTTGQFTSTMFMPLYPLMIAVAGPGWPQLLVDMVLSTVLIWIVYQISCELFADRAAAALAALMVAVYPQLIFFSIIGLTETVYITLVAAALLCWYRRSFVLAAIFAVLSILARPSIDLLAPILVVYFALVIHRMSGVQTLRQILVYAVVYCALMVPWWLHNYEAYGTFVRLNLEGGEHFYSGNNPKNKTGGANGGTEYTTDAFNAISDPVARDKAFLQAGIDYVRADPAAFLHLALLKFVRFWRLWPHYEDYRKPLYVILYCVTYVPIFLLTLVYLALWGVREFFRVAPILAFGAYLTLVNVVFAASMRYRLPLEPFMIVFAAVAFVRLIRRWPAAKSLLSRTGLDAAPAY
ncbi:MAG: glycosyltransferase family 39 protein [Xanthobacteraceae bacterium]